MITAPWEVLAAACPLAVAALLPMPEDIVLAVLLPPLILLPLAGAVLDVQSAGFSPALAPTPAPAWPKPLPATGPLPPLAFPDIAVLATPLPCALPVLEACSAELKLLVPQLVVCSGRSLSVFCKCFDTAAKEFASALSAPSVAEGALVLAVVDTFPETEPDTAAAVSLLLLLLLLAAAVLGAEVLACVAAAKAFMLLLLLLLEAL